MGTRVALNHTTRYTYLRPVQLSPQVVRLRPAPHTRTPVHHYSLRVAPEKHFLNWLQDVHGNFLARIVVPEPAREFEVVVDLVLELEAVNPFDFFLEPYAEKFPFTYPEELRRDLDPYLARSAVTPRLAALIESLDRCAKPSVEFLVDANRAVHSAVKYVVRHEPGVQTPEETLQLGRGSCRDSGWLLVELLRQLGLAARFVSGYLIQLTPDVKPANGPPGPTHDFADLHAWCECYIPGAGWLGLDPTSGLLAAGGHVPLACTPGPASAAPVEGCIEQVETAFSFGMSVRRLAEAARPGRPFTEKSWREVCLLGDRVDAALRASDVRLTFGGEPTFVSSDEPDQPEWNTAALGGRKHELADSLIRRLQVQWHPGAVLQHAFGKWYPGEVLPRWAINSYFRRDGVALWHTPELIATSGRDYGHRSEHAEQFVRRLVQVLGLQANGLMPAHEDAWYYSWRERRLPTNVDVLDSKLVDEGERDRLARVFRQGLGSVVGYVLPLAHRGEWLSGSWSLRDKHCFLLPGDSPMGFRLPLDSQPWSATQDDDVQVAPDPFAPRDTLPTGYGFPLAPPPIRRQRPGDAGPTRSSPFSVPTPGESATGIVRTALCVEPRAGVLGVFLPPLSTLEAWVELVAAIERTAMDTRLPVQLEGYPPPFDPRLGKFGVTPDPGVIEVNVPPVASFPELVAQLDSLYASAQEAHLVPDKFELDGLHLGAGGGQHFVLGGATPADSPFLRRPDLLGSFAAYYNNHPALSYLFSGRFIGPTSQAPRVDEARHEAVYELGIALAQLPAGASSPPWLVDRVMRHLLVDVTGNTHRAELCIDKLFSPDGPMGRLGLVELRAFEMSPHPRMAALNALLVRALVASFWTHPYDRPLARWGTSLHDRFMLPHFLRRDLLDVLADLDGWGYSFEPGWFDPQFEFRFPLLGRVVNDAVLMELRAALEPWPVLGEEATAAGQARFVDSSIERLEVRAAGMTDRRHRVLCNGIELPLHPTGTRGEGVCGVRYRAWQPPSCLHPTIGVHVPLRFDVYDAWNQRALFGCTYRVTHPGGRANLERPVNAEAAESRRLARFEAAGHTPGHFRARRAPANPDYPMTLDLRLFTHEISATDLPDR